MKVIEMKPVVKQLFDLVNQAYADGPLPNIDHIIVTLEEMLEIQKEFGSFGTSHAGILGRNGDKYYGGNLSPNAQNIKTITTNIGDKENPNIQPITSSFFLAGMQVRLEVMGVENGAFGRKST